jgi:hypothetical protein
MENQANQNIVVDPGQLDPDKIIVPTEIAAQLSKMGYSGRNIAVQYINLVTRKPVVDVNGFEFSLEWVDLNPAMAFIVLATFHYYMVTGSDPIEFTDTAIILSTITDGLDFTAQRNIYNAVELLKWFDLLEFPSNEIDGGEYEQDLNRCRLSEIAVKWVKQEVALPSSAMLYKGKIIGHISNPYRVITDLVTTEEYQQIINLPKSAPIDDDSDK